MLRWLIKAALSVAGVLLVVAGVVRAFFAQPLEVGHMGMGPTIAAGDTVLMWKGTPEVGDVAVCTHPQQSGLVVVGRLVATSGEVSVREDGIDVINGKSPDIDWQTTTELEDENGDLRTFGIAEARYGDSNFGLDHRFMVVRKTRNARQRRRAQRFNRTREPRVRDYRLEPGRWFLLGDNRSAPAHDSRTFGGVDPKGCRGSVVMRLEGTPEGERLFEHGWLDFIE